MLVLSRRRYERIFIGEDIVLTYVKTEHNQATFAIQAPRHIEIHREEIYNRIKRGKELEEDVGNIHDGNIRKKEKDLFPQTETEQMDDDCSGEGR